MTLYTSGAAHAIFFHDNFPIRAGYVPQGEEFGEASHVSRDTY